MSEEEEGESLPKKVKDVVNGLVETNVDVEEIKAEVWKDLSDLYYKYDHEAQKKAFREIMYWISEKIQEDKWETVYHRLYRIQKGEQPWE